MRAVQLFMIQMQLHFLFLEIPRQAVCQRQPWGMEMS